jgi:hypothetical protein
MMPDRRERLSHALNQSRLGAFGNALVVSIGKHHRLIISSNSEAGLESET